MNGLKKIEIEVVDIFPDAGTGTGTAPEPAP